LGNYVLVRVFNGVLGRRLLMTKAREVLVKLWQNSQGTSMFPNEEGMKDIDQALSSLRELVVGEVPKDKEKISLAGKTAKQAKRCYVRRLKNIGYNQSFREQNLIPQLVTEINGIEVYKFYDRQWHYFTKEGIIDEKPK